jgi:hypothetical protein
LEKAELLPLPGEPGERVELMFNPTLLTFARTVKWQSEQGNRGNSALPKVNFSGVDPFKLTLSQVVFDTYEVRQSVIEQYIKKLKKGVESPDGQNKRPPVYWFVWGQRKSFPCVMTNLSYKLDLFLPDGTPVRALVDISLQEVEKENLPGDYQPNTSDAARSGSESRASREQRHPVQPPLPPAPTEPSDF